jgi:hypothetical protein
MTADELLLSAPSFAIDDAQAAGDTWGFNCGPGAIAAVVRMTPDELRPYMGDFEQKGYTNPTLMFEILKRLGVGYRMIDKGIWPAYGLVRIQWHGPWMNPGVPIKARYRKTHWIGCRDTPGGRQMFDVNCMCVGGWVPEEEWKEQVAPWLAGSLVKGYDGNWSMTHCIEVETGIRIALPATQFDAMAEDNMQTIERARDKYD